MANINDYLLWRGDIPFSASFPFNEIDSMILSRISYLLFDKISLEDVESIESVSKKMKDFSNDDFLYNGDKELITNLGESKRFKNLVVTDYIKINDEEKEKQFGAITIHLPNNEMYVSYMGTDSTINGWKEDFNMAFMDNVPCQISGKNYLHTIASKYKTKEIRVGGHSKGGNVAVYSAITNPKTIQKRIIKVYNYDGPGLSKDIIDNYINEDIVKKIETYIPQESIIGRILNHKEKITITYSTEKSIYQHDIYSWQIFRNDLIKSEKNTDTSENIDKTLTDWLALTSPNQRKIFIDTIFELFKSTDASTFGEMSTNWKESIPKILKTYNEISSKDKKVMVNMIKKLIKSNMNIIKEQNTMKFINMRDEYINRSIETVENFDKKYLNKLKKNNLVKKS